MECNSEWTIDNIKKYKTMKNYHICVNTYSEDNFLGKVDKHYISPDKTNPDGIKVNSKSPYKKRAWAVKFAKKVYDYIMKDDSNPLARIPSFIVYVEEEVDGVLNATTLHTKNI